MRCLIPFFFLALWTPLAVFPVSADAYAKQISSNDAVVGEAVNIAAFGRQLSGDNYIGRQWDNPRDTYEVRISGIDRRVAESLRLEWWGSVWPNNGTGGWMRLDDGFADGVPVFLVFNPRTWKSVQRQKVTGIFTVKDISGQSYDLLDARKLDYKLMTEDFFTTLQNPAVYGPRR